jgi:flagellar motor protein MotB
VLRYLLATGNLDENNFSISGYGTARPLDIDLPEGETGRNDTIRIIYKKVI